MHTGNFVVCRQYQKPNYVFELGETPYVCLECNRYFNDNSNLQKHKRIHLGFNYLKDILPGSQGRSSMPTIQCSLWTKLLDENENELIGLRDEFLGKLNRSELREMSENHSLKNRTTFKNAKKNPKFIYFFF